MSLSFPNNHQFLDQLYKKDLFLSQGFKTTNESCYFPKYKLSLSILIHIQITNDIYPKNQLLSHE